MAKRTLNAHAGRDEASGSGTPGAEEAASAQSPAEQSSGSTGSGVPKWRQIEIMQERAQLRRMLDDLDMDYDELELEVFGSQAEHDAFYRQLDEADEEEVDIVGDDDDGYDDDDFEDLEE